MKAAKKTLAKLERMYQCVLVLALLLSCDAAMAGKFFTDDFKDGNHLDQSPVSWSIGEGVPSAIAISDGELKIATNARGSTSVWADSPNSNYRDGIFRTQLSWTEFSRPEAYAGLWVRSANLGESIWAGMQPGGAFGIGRSGNGQVVVGEWRANSSLDAFNGYVNLELAVKGTQFSMTAWQEGRRKPTRPQFEFFDDNFPVGTIGVSADPNSIRTTTVGFRYFQALPYLTGDYSDSGALDSADIDLLSLEIAAGTNDLSHDLTDDSLVNQDDLAFWVKDLKNTWFGDSNLDGEFNSADLIAIFTAGEYEDAIEDNSGWAEGDWDGDGDFNSGDLIAAFTDGGYEQGSRPAANAVPEPASIVMLMFGLIGIAVRRRRVVV
jgi:hypothetical protein